MKNWLDKMERRFGRYAIRNLTMYLLAGYAIGYLLSFTMPQLLTYFTLEPALILKGQVWRLLSWVIIPPNDNIIFVIFMMLLYYSLGNTLESYWGGISLQCLHFFRDIIYGYRSFYCEWTDRRRYRIWKPLQYLLYQYVYFPCMCIHHAGLSAFALRHYPGQDEVACNSGCGSACGRRSAGRSDHTDRDHRITFEFYYFLFLQPESAWTQSETGCPQKEIPEADKPSAESVCRRCKAQMCSVRTY